MHTLLIAASTSVHIPDSVARLLYIVAAALFIFGLKGLSHPRTAVRGNMLGALGMLVAVVTALLDFQVLHYTWIIVGIVIGAGIGIYLAKTTAMTGMPQMVALLNGFGGGASFVVAWAALLGVVTMYNHAMDMQDEITTVARHSLAPTPESSAVMSENVEKLFSGRQAMQGEDMSDEELAAHMEQYEQVVQALRTGSLEMVYGDEEANFAPQGYRIPMAMLIATVASGLIGSVTLFGSLVAFGKLQEYRWIPDGAMIPMQQILNAVLFIVCIVLGALLVMNPAAWWWYLLLVVVAAVLGLLLTQPIGGADMPVVIALLNSYSGLAACATGFVIGNSVLIISGALVGASGLILTAIMCKAMNRSLPNVVFGTMGATADTPNADDVYAGKVKSTSPDEVAMLFDTAQRVVVVPGYGLAVAQAQHAVRDMANLLESRGVTVEYAIHPVAGRMPGHMNVLLAEADVPYDQLKEMDEINPTMEQVDVCMVIGANDVVNPVARTDPKSPIAGMPIIDVDKARTVVVVKRSLSPGFAGIPNPLFAADNTLMLFGDGKKAILELVSALKES